MKKLLVLVIGLLMLAACSNEQKEPVNLLDQAMEDVFAYEINKVEPEHEEKINRWLEQARRDGTDGQFHVNGVGGENEKYNYTYVYKKGSSDYQVYLIYNAKDPDIKARLHVTGTKKADNVQDGFVQIKMLNDQLSSLIIVSDDPLDFEGGGHGREEDKQENEHEL